MDILKNLKTKKWSLTPLKKSKSATVNKNSAISVDSNSASDSADNYCYERRSQTSLESDGLYSPSRPSSQPLYSRPPISKPPADFLRPKLYQGNKKVINDRPEIVRK